MYFMTFLDNGDYAFQPSHINVKLQKNDYRP